MLRTNVYIRKSLGFSIVLHCIIGSEWYLNVLKNEHFLLHPYAFRIEVEKFDLKWL